MKKHSKKKEIKFSSEPSSIASVLSSKIQSFTYQYGAFVSMLSAIDGNIIKRISSDFLDKMLSHPVYSVLHRVMFENYNKDFNRHNYKYILSAPTFEKAIAKAGVI